MFWVAARGFPQAASFHLISGPSTFAWANALLDHATTLAANTAATVTMRLMNAS
jgi:hypothetical protein